MHVLMYGNETCKVFTNVYFIGGHVPKMMRSVIEVNITKLAVKTQSVIYIPKSSM